MSTSPVRGAELVALVALVIIVLSLWATNRQLNRELAQVQAGQGQALIE